MEKEFVVREIQYEGEVGAGRVYPFVPKEGTISVAVPADIPESELGTMKINGRSLERVGIFDGDIVVVRKFFNKKEVNPDTVCVVWVESYNEVMAKKVEFRDGQVLLHYCGPEPFGSLLLPAEQVVFRGKVISTSRHQDLWPFLTTPGEMMTDRELPKIEKIAPKVREAKIIEAIDRFKKPEFEEPF